MASFTVSSGVTSSGNVLGDNETGLVLSGGTASSTAVAGNNAILTVNAGGTAVSATVSSGGSAVVFSGGKSIETVLSGGTLTNSGIVSGANHAVTGGGTIINTGAGSIAGTTGNGVDLASGGSVTNSGSASQIAGGNVGVYLHAAGGAVTNEGTITGKYNLGVDLAAGGAVINGGTASAIAGQYSGLYVTGGAGTVTNAGSITGKLFDGVGLFAGGLVANTGSAASIAGGAIGIEIAGASGSVTNEGTIAGTKGAGISLAVGGAVTNSGTASDIAGNTHGVAVGGAAGTVTNAGAITGAVANGVDLASGGSVTNTGSASHITGGNVGVYLHAAGAVTNQGTITGKYNLGVDLFAGGAVTNSGTASAIAGQYSGVFITNSAGTVTNAGSIKGKLFDGVGLLAGGLVENTGSAASIAGGAIGIEIAGASGSVTNEGAIAGTKGAGISLAVGGAVTNSGTASDIAGSTHGVQIDGAAGTVTNAGAITGAVGNGVDLASGGSVTNTGSASHITGGNVGVYLHAAGGAVTNQGTITGKYNLGVDLFAGGSVTNSGTASAISGQYSGVYVTGAAGAVTNAGSITGKLFDGVGLFAGGLVENTGSAASIAGGKYGVYIDGGAGTVINAGTIAATNGVGVLFSDLHGKSNNTLVDSGSIIGNSGTAVQFAAGNDLLQLLPGASFTGLVDGALGTDTLELAEGTGAGSLTGLGTNFTNFEHVTVDNAAIWTLTGANNIAGGTLTDHGTLLLKGTLLADGGTATISGAAGNFADAIVSGAGAVWNGSAELVVGDNGNGALRISNQGTVQTNGDASIDPSQGLDIGQFADVAGAVTVDGNKSLLNNTGRFVVGDAGFGVLLIQNRGTVITDPGNAAGVAGAVIGAQAGSDGSSVSVTGPGSNWQVSGQLVVGNDAAGSLAITRGGKVTADGMDAGALDDGSGIVSVVGIGSSLSLTGQLTVGDAASAELSILAGGTVSATDGDIGLGSGGTGNVDLEGAGSRLNFAHDLDIGGAGVGVLTLGNNTELTVVHNLNVGVKGVINSFGGVIDPEVITNKGQMGGSGTITADVSIVNSGTLFASGGSYMLITPLITAPSGEDGALDIRTNGTLVVNAGSVDATQLVGFSDGTGVLSIGTLAGFGAVITNFIAGDKIIVQGTSIAATSYNETTDILTLFNAAHATIGTLQFGASVTGANLAADGTGAIGAPVCFAAGTRIATPGGEVPVELLAAGDAITTLHGEASVKWLGWRRIDLTAHPRPETVAPVRIKRGAFADSVPHTDLLLSPDHAIFVDGRLICARQLINGTTIRQENDWTEVQYFHVELDTHAILIAEGLPAESYLDTGNHGFFVNADAPLVLHPDLTDETDYPTREAGSCAPFVWDEASVRPVWQRLAERAAALGQPAPRPATTNDPALRVVASGRTLRPLYGEDGHYIFALPKGATEVRLVSRAGAPTDMRPWLEDRRCLGAYVERILLRSASEVREVPLDHPGLSQGWWALEQAGTAQRRWTRGDAVLPLPVVNGPMLLEIQAGNAGMAYLAGADTVNRHAA